MKKIIMRYGTLYLIILFSFLPGLINAEKISEEGLKGEWIKKECLDSIKITRAIIDNGNACLGMVEITVKKEPSGYKWMGIYNYHEGTRDYSLGKLKNRTGNKYWWFYDEKNNESIIFEPTKVSDNIITEFKLINMRKHVPPSYKGREITVFVRKNEKIEDFANQVILVGRYKDRKGRIFEFTKNSVAKWPDKYFSYKISVDGVRSPGNESDNFMMLENSDDSAYLIGSAIYGYSWSKNTLQIYNGCVSGQEGKGLLLYSLTPIK